eukprot:5778257-Pyramimonas_sp.AAC.1
MPMRVVEFVLVSRRVQPVESFAFPGAVREREAVAGPVRALMGPPCRPYVCRSILEAGAVPDRAGAVGGSGGRRRA